MLRVSEICNRINGLRLEQGWNQQEMARHLKVSQPAVSAYLRDRIPPPEILLRLARLGNTTIEWILTGEKSYKYLPDPTDIAGLSVQESYVGYDADWDMARKIARLDPVMRSAVIR